MSYYLSNKESIKKLSNEWRINKVKYIFKVISGSTPESNNMDYWDGDITWITPADMSDFGTISDGGRSITIQGYNSCGTTLVPKNSIVISNRAPIGKINLTEKELCTNQGCKCLVSNLQNNKYYYYLFYALKDELISLGRGTTFKELSTYDLSNFKIIELPLNDQKSIVNFLDNKISKIDSVIVGLNKQINILYNYKKSIITEKIINTYKIEPNNNKYFNGIPKEYIKRFKDFFVTNTGLNITKENLIDEGLDVISYGQIHSKTNKTTHINDELIRFVDIKYSSNVKSFVNVGDMIFADTSEDLDGVGNCILNDRNKKLYAGYHTIIASPKDKRYSKYLAYLFMTDSWRSQLREIVNGVKVFSITQQILKNTKIILPPIDTINVITDYLDKECERLDIMIENKQKQIEKLEIYKQSLIYEYVTGKKRVKGE